MTTTMDAATDYVNVHATRELKRLSEWTDTPNLIVKRKSHKEVHVIPNLGGLEKNVLFPEDEVEWYLPHYDSNYLITRMPPFLEFNQKIFFFGLMAANNNETPTYCAAYYHYALDEEGDVQVRTMYQQKDSSPQDALADLLITLYQKGKILKMNEIIGEEEDE